VPALHKARSGGRRMQNKNKERIPIVTAERRSLQHVADSSRLFENIVVVSQLIELNWEKKGYKKYNQNNNNNELTSLPGLHCERLPLQSLMYKTETRELLSLPVLLKLLNCFETLNGWFLESFEY
jgi:hypothetical protein